MRVTEIMQDFRNIQSYIAGIRTNPSTDEYNEDGFVLLRRCVAEAQSLLVQPFNSLNGGRGNDEADKANLRRYA